MQNHHHHDNELLTRGLSAGLHGDYRGACVSCLTGTDTGLVADGSAEWILAVLQSVGVPDDEAIAVMGWSQNVVPFGRLRRGIRVCQSCAGTLPVGCAAASSLPVVAQP